MRNPLFAIYPRFYAAANNTEPAPILRTPERRKSFRKSAGTREQIHHRHDPRHGVLPIGQRA